jgi:hypothetical protein
VSDAAPPNSRRRRWRIVIAILGLLLAARVSVLWIRAQYRLSWVGHVGEDRWQLVIARPDALYLALGRYNPSIKPTVPPPLAGYPAVERKAFLANAGEWKRLRPARGFPRAGATSLSGRTPATASYLTLPYWLVIFLALAPIAMVRPARIHRDPG